MAATIHTMTTRAPSGKGLELVENREARGQGITEIEEPVFTCEPESGSPGLGGKTTVLLFPEKRRDFPGLKSRAVFAGVEPGAKEKKQKARGGNFQEGTRDESVEGQGFDISHRSGSAGRGGLQ